ncbi:PAS domain S-box protein [Polaromonas sp. CG_9.11]|uniref:PAS domain S-box protein n=1 Tax=Polaromonas sp. CG_9.11 TaxID=2787730 RepID=UPI001A34C08B|nr:PAS domain S-box protein [Polaromonas sp. CG_9.11]MBG6078255.1 PAS domain S-box-containing protein [Polaromonas sp. CG_9.11]
MSNTVDGVGADDKSGASAGDIECRRQESLFKTIALQDAIFNSTNFSSIATDAQGVIQIFNVGAERMLGYNSADVVDKITPADISDPQELIARAQALSVDLVTPIAPGFDALVFKASRGIEDIYELNYIRKDGRRFPAVVSVTALRDAQNKVIGYLLIGTDNTARKQVEAEKALLEELLWTNEERFKLMIGGSEKVFFFTRDTQHRFTYLSPSTVHVLGYNAANLIGKSYEILVIPDDPVNPNVNALADKALQYGMPCEPYTAAVRHKDGRRILLEIVESPVYQDAKIVGIQGFARDVTERVRAQNELENSETRFHNFFERAAVGMVIVSESGRYLRVNQRFADIIGHTKEEIVGHLSAEATHPADREREAMSIAQLREGQSEALTWEKRYLRKDGNAVWCTFSLSMLSLEEDNHPQFIGVVEDISKRKCSEEVLRHSEVMIRIAGKAAKLGGWMLDLQSQLLHWSDEVRAIHEVPPDFEPTLAQAIEYYPQEYRHQVTEQVARCAEDGTPFNFEHELITATGRRIWVLAIGEAMRDQQGLIVKVQGVLQDITARKETQASLAETQRRFREMADTFPFMVWTAEPDGQIEFANRAFHVYCGGDQNTSSSNSGSHINWIPLIHREDRQHCLGAWETSVRTGTSYLVDYRLRESVSGEYQWHRVQADPVRDAAGKIVNWYGLATNINETKLLEQKTNILANRLKNTLESITDGFFILDGDWTFAFLNKEAAHMLDRTREGLLRKSFWSEFQQLVGTAVEDQFLEAARSGLPVHLNECQLLSPDGWYAISAYPSEEGMAIYFRDVTQTRAALAQLGLLESAVSHLNDIVLITEAEPFDGAGPRIVFVNKAFERHTGYTQAEVIGKTPRILQGPKTDRAELDRIVKALRAWQPVRVELINYTKDGREFWVELEIVPIADSKGWFTHWVSVQRDISERKRAQEAILRHNDLEEQVKRRTRQLEAANKELEAFSYSISHDLRSPLSTINGFSQLLLKSDGDQFSEKGRHYLNRIRAGATNMGVLIDGLLSLAKISRAALNRQEVDLTAMSFKLVQELRDSEPNRVVDIDIQADLIINGDLAMVTVVMQNLIGNAWKYSSKASHAHVQIGSETLEGGMTCIFVLDNGAGFDMAYGDKLFEVFQRLHQDTEFKGTGIGLANVKRVVERHGGRIWAQAAPGEGATFRFTL